jgi:hypothetical protein
MHGLKSVILGFWKNECEVLAVTNKNKRIFDILSATNLKNISPLTQRMDDGHSM